MNKLSEESAEEWRVRMLALLLIESVRDEIDGRASSFEQFDRF